MVIRNALVHARTSGLADYLAETEHDAIRIGRDIVAHLRWRKSGAEPSRDIAPPAYDVDSLLSVPSADIRIPFDVHEAIARIADGSQFEEFKPLYGSQLICGWASIAGFRSESSGTTASFSPRSRRRARSSSSSATASMHHSSSSRTSPDSWSGHGTSKAASSRTGQSS